MDRVRVSEGCCESLSCDDEDRDSDCRSLEPRARLAKDEEEESGRRPSEGGVVGLGLGLGAGLEAGAGAGAGAGGGKRRGERPDSTRSVEVERCRCDAAPAPIPESDAVGAVAARRLPLYSSLIMYMTRRVMLPTVSSAGATLPSSLPTMRTACSISLALRKPPLPRTLRSTSTVALAQGWAPLSCRLLSPCLTVTICCRTAWGNSPIAASSSSAFRSLPARCGLLCRRAWAACTGPSDELICATWGSGVYETWQCDQPG